MKLYHYTAISRMPFIIQEGLTKGEIPTSLHSWINGVNLTTDPRSAGHGLSGFRYFTKRELYYQAPAFPAHQAIPHWSDKREVRITLDVEKSSLTRWLRWAQKNCDAAARDMLIESGGGIGKARTWFFSLDPIPASRFTMVEVIHNGRWIPFEDYNGPMEETVTDEAIEQGLLEWGERLLVGRPESQLARFRSAWERAASKSLPVRYELAG